MACAWPSASDCGWASPRSPWLASSRWSPTAARVLEGEPVVLVRHGRVNQRGLARERISLGTLHARLREAGASPPFHDVRLALLEVDGNISVLLGPPEGHVGVSPGKDA